MPSPNPAAMDFLLTRRSRPAKTLQGPAPSRAALEPILTAALRTPDHGKLEPWRLIVLEEAALRRIAGEVRAAGQARGLDEAERDKAASAYDLSPLAVVVVEVPKPSEKIPAIEMTYSAGAVCLALVNAALASGWGANWLSGWPSHDRPEIFGTAPGERIAGIIHIGTERSAPPERPRPDVAALTTWVSS